VYNSGKMYLSRTCTTGVDNNKVCVGFEGGGWREDLDPRFLRIVDGFEFGGGGG